MVRRTVKRSKDQGIYYICSTYNKGQGCSRHSIEERMIEEIVLDAVKRHIAQVEEMDQMFAMLSSMEVNYGDVLANDKEIQAKYNELEKCRRMQLALRKDLLAGIISEEEQIQFGKIYAEREDAIKKSIAALREEMELIFDKGLMVNQWIKNLADSQNISKLNRDIVLNLIEKIIVYEDSRLEIIFKYEDKYKAVCQIVQNFIKEFGEEADSIG